MNSHAFKEWTKGRFSGCSYKLTYAEYLKMLNSVSEAALILVEESNARNVPVNQEIHRDSR